MRIVADKHFSPYSHAVSYCYGVDTCKMTVIAKTTVVSNNNLWRKQFLLVTVVHFPHHIISTIQIGSDSDMLGAFQKREALEEAIPATRFELVHDPTRVEHILGFGNPIHQGIPDQQMCDVG